MQWSRNVAVAQWIVERLHPFAQDVGSLVPDGFAAYARIRHPEAGTLDRPRLDALLDILARHTPEAKLCWFAVWDGYAWLHGHSATSTLTRDGGRPARPPAELTPPPERVRAPRRSFALYRGELRSAQALWDLSWEQSPNLWWPDDHGWCVATDVDQTSTYLGGSATLIHDLLDDRELTTQPASPNDAISDDAAPDQA
ncbi:hypothetical protein AB0H83_51410 [Dactylosporangium sp. NPDC050688]|uniref:hypothetical protein n=1 Tax=Dactylosporangium sp. NPDC050688 TaxID=3157217 RepID=UPI0033FD079D